MEIWSLTPDTPRQPQRVSPGESVGLQRVEEHRVDAAWERNEGPNSYWRAHIGPFAAGDEVTCTVRGLSPQGEVEGPSATFRAGPQIYLALLWHQHQPLYKDTSRKASRGSYLHPWVRLHSIRDYYSMAALVGEHPGGHLTINLTPVLMWQLEDYLVRGATDQALELTLKPADKLTGGEREEILSAFFDADWHNQIFPHRRYKELFLQRQERGRFSAQEIRDLQMWFNLAWFGSEFRTLSVPLVTGKTASVQRFIAQGRGFSVADIENMMEEQYKVMRAVIPLHRALQERGQIEVSTTPFHHPILPLLVDTDQATMTVQGRVCRDASPTLRTRKSRCDMPWRTIGAASVGRRAVCGQPREP